MATREEDAYLRSLEKGVAKGVRFMRGPRPARRAGVTATHVGGGLSVTVSLAGGQGNPVNAGPINFTVTFSEAATGFTNADVSTTGSTVGGTLSAAVTGTGPAYNVAITGMTGNGIVVVSIPAAAATSTAKGTPFPASNTATVTFDTAAPTVTINQAVGQADPAAVSPITFTVVFSEVVTGFLASDVSITGTAGGTKVASLSGSGPTYSIEITGMTTGGTVIASIPAAATTDLAGNASGASTSTDNTVAWTPDTTRPDVTINKAAAQADPSSGGSSIIFDVVFTESVTGFTDADVTLSSSTTGGTLSASISGSGATYTVTVSGMAAPDGNIIASIAANVAQDAAGNLNFASTSTDNIVAWTAPVASTSVQTYFIIAGQY